MDKNFGLEKEDMDEIIAKLETLFEENPQYDMEKLKKYLNRTGELTIEVNKIKEEIKANNPDISHDELIAEASQRIADMVQERDALMENNEIEQ